MAEFGLVIKMSNDGLICNASELKEALSTELKKYDYVVTEENYDQAKKERTSLNNLEKRIKETRKQFEEVELASWKTAKALIMDCEKLIKEVSDKLGDGAKDIDTQQALVKKDNVRKIIEPRIMMLGTPLNEIAFELIYDHKEFDKKTMKTDKIIETLLTRLENIKEMWSLFEGQLPEDNYIKSCVTDSFLNDLDLGNAKRLLDDMVARKARLEQQESLKNQPEPVDVEQQVQESTANDEWITFTFKIRTNKAIRDDLNALFTKHKPQYEMLHKEVE